MCELAIQLLNCARHFNANQVYIKATLSDIDVAVKKCQGQNLPEIKLKCVDYGSLLIKRRQKPNELSQV